MTTREVATEALIALGMACLVAPAAALYAWNSYRRWKLRSPGILFLSGFGITFAGFAMITFLGSALNPESEPGFQARLAAGFMLLAAGISNMAISLYLAHVYANAIKSGQEPVPSLREGPRRLRSLH